jgi:glycosyltransferase involved in cell wall biosynthesis
LRIGLIIYGDLDILSGGFLYDRMLVEHLRSCGDHVEVFSLPWRSYGRCLLDNCSRGLVRRLADSKLDILVQDELNHPSLFWRNHRIRKTVDCPIVSIVHHLRCCEFRARRQNQVYGWIESSYLATVDGFIFNSRTTRQEVSLRRWDIPNCVVAYPAGDRLAPDMTGKQVQDRAFEPGPLRILFVGSLIRRKGLHNLLKAVELLPPGLCRLDVVGHLDADRQYVKRIQSQIDSGELADRVRLLGPAEGEDLKLLYERSHVLAVPSSYEGFGIVYLEGMGFGLPAIASTRGAAHELVTHGRNGFLVPPEDSGAIARYLGRMSKDRRMLAAMSMAALTRYRAFPTWQQTAEKVRRFLVQMVGSV